MTRHTNVQLAGSLCAAIAVLLPAIPPRAFAADEVRVYLTVNGVEGAAQLHNAGDPIGIDVTPIGNNLVTMIRINAEAPSQDGQGQLFDIGPITITGSRGIGERLRVLIAGFDDNNDEYTTFPALASDPIPAGARHWAGIVSGNSTTQLTLREFTNLAASITGNLDEVGASTGSKIDVGKVVRLQARYPEPSTLGGNIRLPVSAWFNWTYDDGSAIGYIVASNLISADIECKYDASITGTQASIDRITVGPSANAAGISGRILAPYGRIHQIRSTGPIEIDTAPGVPGILAGGREDAPFRDGIDFIMAGVPVPGDPDTPDPDAARDIDAVIVCQSPSGQSLLQHLRTAGDLKRPVFADALGWPYFQGSPTEERGIFVGGTVHGPITIKDSVYLASIVAGTFAPGADITIGNLLKGRIEAIANVGTPAEPDWEPGYLRTVSIGLSPPTQQSIAYPGNGMNGWSPNDNDPESVVRAKEIERFEASRVFLDTKNHAPAVLADVIGEVDIGTMQHGIIAAWTLDPTDAPVPRVELAKVRIGTITYANGGDGGNYEPAKVWTTTFHSFVIEEDNAGELHFSEIPDGRALFIGNGMRGPYDDGGSTAWHDGAVLIDDPHGLQGLVVINAAGAANPDPADSCSGPVTIENGTTDISLSAAASPGDIDTLPQYTRTSDTIGGGAVGLAPFYLYDVDCRPINNAVGEHALLQSQFENFANDSVPTAPIVPAWYGGVRTNLTSGSPVNIYLILVLNSQTVLQLIPESNYTVACKRGTDPGMSRFISIVGSGQHEWAAGRYRVESKAVGSGGLFCDGVEASPALAVEPYYFTLRLDCDHDGVEDEQEDCIICGVGDFNQDGGVDGGDVEAFFTAWENAEPAADVNQDGGIDGGDVQTFFLAWEAGC
ncbi:MAG: hypothetical protein JNK25_02960 [Phycisphaerae bacterium]|nr:hypothetical protein [Phycisphaerae bacterium]